jgi:hypothetical protein
VAAAGVQLLVQLGQLRGDEGPVVERGLQRRGDTVGNVRRFEVAGDNGQLAVTGAIIDGSRVSCGVRCFAKPIFYCTESQINRPTHLRPKN